MLFINATEPVIAPIALRNKMRKKLEATFENYQNLDPPPVISL